MCCFLFACHYHFNSLIRHFLVARMTHSVMEKRGNLFRTVNTCNDGLSIGAIYMFCPFKLAVAFHLIACSMTKPTCHGCTLPPTSEETRWT